MYTNATRLTGKWDIIDRFVISTRIKRTNCAQLLLLLSRVVAGCIVRDMLLATDICRLLRVIL